jgi:hypothetical protein
MIHRYMRNYVDFSVSQRGSRVVTAPIPVSIIAAATFSALNASAAAATVISK